MKSRADVRIRADIISIIKSVQRLPLGDADELLSI